MKFLYCKLKGHELKLLPTGSAHINEFECVHCQYQYLMDNRGKLKRLNRYWKENNRTFSKQIYKE